MSARPFTSRWLNWKPTGNLETDSLRGQTRNTRKTSHEDSSAGFAGAAEGEIRSKKVDSPDLLTGTPVAVRLTGTRYGDVWLVLDEDVLVEHPDIATAGLPVFYFDELRYLARLDGTGLASVAACKRAFPTGRLLQ